MTVDEFLDTVRAKRAERGLSSRLADASLYRLLDGVLAGRTRAGGRQ